jgi:hypothetical protein
VCVLPPAIAITLFWISAQSNATMRKVTMSLHHRFDRTHATLHAMLASTPSSHSAFDESCHGHFMLGLFVANSESSEWTFCMTRLHLHILDHAVSHAIDHHNSLRTSLMYVGLQLDIHQPASSQPDHNFSR